MMELRRFFVGYGQTPLLELPLLQLEPGRISTILGVNGGGKSTLLRAMAGQLPYGGSVQVNGQEISALPHRTRARLLSYLPQTLTTPDMDVYTLVSHGRFARLGRSKTLGDSDRVAIRAAMEQTGVWDLRDRSCKTLSGGQKQSAYLAMAIAQDAPYLLLDEPDTYLDVNHQLHVQQILRQLADSGKGIVTVSHDIAAAFTFADDLCVLTNDGKAVCGTPQEILEQGVLPGALGVGLQRTEDSRLLFRYALTKEDDHAGDDAFEPQQF